MNGVPNGINGNGRKLNIGHIIIIVVFLVGQGFSFWGLSLRYESRISRLEDGQRSVLEGVDKLTTLVRFMDENGTHKSQASILTETQLAASTARRMDNQEQVMSTLVPKIERMSVNLEWMMRYFEKENKVPVPKANP